MSPNPYQAPNAPIQPTAGTGETCPRCNSHDVKAPGYTFWGGVIGPKLLNHRICRACNFGFNAKTRRSNMGAIITYQVVLFIIAFVVFALAYWR